MLSANASIAAILQNARTIAVVGLSEKPERDSHIVAAYLQRHGYRIIPVNPSCAGKTVLNEHCYATLTEAARQLSEQGRSIDVVDCFRRPDSLDPILDEAIAIGARVLWMQLGVVNESVATRAEKAGLAVVMDHCMKLEHMAHAK